MIDREAERVRLLQAADEAPQLVVMRGRRRVGKSYLLDHCFAGRRFVYLQADEGHERGHLDFLAGEVGRLTGAPLSFADWDAALEYLGAQAEHEPLVVVLDEFQWLRKAQPLLPSIIMRHFDAWERHERRVTLVLSGSALTLMEEMLEGDQPMFGRAAYRPLLDPFDFRHAAAFGPASASAEERLIRYALLGGTAQYQVWAGEGPIAGVLRERLLAKDESLFEEPLQLIRGEDEIREPGNYYEILRAIADGATQFSQIASRSKVSSSQVLTHRLRRLERLRYVEERRSVGGTGRAVWTIADPFFRFWFRYVYPNRSRLQRGRAEEVAQLVLSDLDNFVGPIFEQVCRSWAGTYASAEQFPAAETIGAYWTRRHDVEVDVVARTGNRCLAVGSVKWSKQADTHVLDRLLECRQAIKGAATATPFIFARGFHPALVSKASTDGARLISLDDLYT